MSETPSRMPVRTRVVDMDGDYAGFHATMRVNVSMQTLDALSNADDIFPTVAEIVQEWNFVDEEGKPIPPGVNGLRAIPLDLFRMLQSKFGEVLRNPLAGTTSPVSSKPSPRVVSRRRASSPK